MKIALGFFLVMQCVKPSIPSNSRIIYPRTDQVRYTHATTLYLACQQGHLLTGSPIMVCNYTTWLKREFRCIGMFSPMRSHQSYIVWPPPLITTNINHKPISLLKETKDTSSELLRENRSFHHLPVGCHLRFLRWLRYLRWTGYFSLKWFHAHNESKKCK